MRRFDLWKLSLLNVFVSPVRSLLTILGMAIGVGAILAVLTLGEAGRTQVRSELARLGIDKVWVTSAENQLLLGDGKLLSDALTVATAETAYLPLKAWHKEWEGSLTAVGCTQVYLDMTGVRVCTGRMLYPLEWEEDGRCVLLGTQAAQKLHADVGDILHLHGMPFRVAGLVEGADAFSRTDPSSSVFVPIRVLCGITGNAIQEILLDVPHGSMPQTVAAMAQSVLAQKRGVAADTLTMQVQMEAADSVIAIFVDVLKWVALVCILVGGIGVMNILLVSVRERRREIGVMKSLGAGYGQICTLFLLEALLYALIGGLLGVCIGLGLISAAAQSIGLHAQARAGDCAAVFAVSLVVGLFFGVLPASRAAGMSCVDALREEP